jgi:uncharacterized MAPEG superfamily protein
MSSELTILALYGLFVMALILVQALAALAQVGLVTLAGDRENMPVLVGLAGRLDRAQLNSVVALALFAPAVLILAKMGYSSPATLLASQIFLIARVIFAILYATGTPWLRSLAWLVGFVATGWLYCLAF